MNVHCTIFTDTIIPVFCTCKIVPFLRFHLSEVAILINFLPSTFCFPLHTIVMSCDLNLKKLVFILALASSVLYISYLIHQSDVQHYVFSQMFLTQVQLSDNGSDSSILQGETTTNTVTLEEQQENIGNPLLVLFWTGNKVKVWSNYWTDAQKAGAKCRAGSPLTQKLACNFTMDKNLVDDADALIYMGTDRDRGPLPPRPHKDKTGGQIRMVYMREAPQWLVANSIKTFPSGFNWTFTYRNDSDISANYGVVVPLDINSTASFTSTWTDDNLSRHELEIPDEKLVDYMKTYINGKTGLIAWTVSHCATHSKREKIVKKLQKFIPVDVYGKCGPFKCSTPREKNWPSCYPELGAKYKFYLSFENALCEDYVTEKFYFALENGMVPIVYGGANYNKFAPPGSFINILDFASLQHLTAYIQFLDKNPMEYLKYFLWKEKYRIGHLDHWCDMCTALWRHTVVDPTSRRNVIDPKYSKIYPDMRQWFFYSKEEDNNATENSTRNKPREACQSPSKLI